MTTSSQDNEEINQEEDIIEAPKMPPPAQKISKFGNPGGMSKFGKGATNFNPPNKQRPGRAAGRGR